MRIETLFLDFGGCIDAPGVHTRTLFWQAFHQSGLVDESGRPAFQIAYSLADKRMMETGEAKELALMPFNRLNGRLIAEALGIGGDRGEEASDYVTQEMIPHLNAAAPLFKDLSRKVSLGLISNFTGNLEVILREFKLRDFFSSVTESFYEGCSKPDLRIFHAALSKQTAHAGACLFVGDNPVNDIAPAKLLGIKTALIHLPGEKRECGADFYIEKLAELLDIVERTRE